MNRTTSNKRKFLISAIAAAALTIGGTSAFAVASDSDDGAGTSSSDRGGAQNDSTDDRDDSDDQDDRDDDGRDDDGDDRRADDRDDRDDAKELAGAKLSAKEAVDKALAAVPGGTVQSVDLDDDSDDGAKDRRGLVWEADVLGKDKKWYEVTLDADTGKLLDKHADQDDAADDRGDDDRDDRDDRDDD